MLPTTKSLCIVTGIYPPDMGGPASSTEAVAKHFCRAGWRVRVIHLCDHLSAEQHEIPNLRITSIRRSTLKPLRWIQTIWEIFRNAVPGEILYSNGLNFESFIASLFLRTHYIAKVVGDYAWERSRNWGWTKDGIDDFQKRSPNFKTSLLKFVRSFPLKFAKSIIVPSKYLGEMVSVWGVPANRIQVVYNAFIPFNEAPESHKPDHVFRIITVCRLVNWKGVEGLLASIKDVSQVEVWIVGDGPLEEELKIFASKHKISAKFWGAVSRSEVSKLIQQSHVLVLNSTYEGLPHVILEAFALGVPCIATAIGGTPEVIDSGKNGITIPVGNDSELKSAILKLMHDKQLYFDFSQEARKTITLKFSFEKMMKELEEALTNPNPCLPAKSCQS